MTTLLLIILGAVGLIFVVGLGVFLFACANEDGMGKRGYAPGWQVRCPGCGRVREAADLGIVRLKAAGTKRILGRCKECAGFKMLILERSGPSE